jgi:predicted SAM-dependent methyltransferase
MLKHSDKEFKIKPHMKLDLGSGNPAQGEVQPEGYVLNDVEPHPGIDIVCNIKDIHKVIPKGYCSVVRASHVLEHFTTKETQEVIRMVHDLLEPQGKFLIFVPNFRWHADLVITGNDEMAVHYAFGGQLDEYDLHKTGYTPKILRKYLEENGFTVVSMGNDTSIECLALKT